MKTDTETKTFTVESALLENIVSAIASLTGGLVDPASGETVSQYGVGGNAAEQYCTDVFVIRDYCWCNGQLHPPIATDQAAAEDDDDLDWGLGSNCPPNFEHYASGLKVEWYKHLGRSMVFNKDVSTLEACDILRDCVAEIDRQLQQRAYPIK